MRNVKFNAEQLAMLIDGLEAGTTIFGSSKCMQNMRQRLIVRLRQHWSKEIIR